MARLRRKKGGKAGFENPYCGPSYMFLDKKTVLEIWLNLGLNLTIFRGTGTRIIFFKTSLESSIDRCLRQKASLGIFMR